MICLIRWCRRSTSESIEPLGGIVTTNPNVRPVRHARQWIKKSLRQILRANCPITSTHCTVEPAKGSQTRKSEAIPGTDSGRSVQPTGLCNQSVCAWEWVGTEDDSRRQLRKRCRDASNPMSPQVPGFPGHGPLPGAHDERQGTLANRPRTFRSGRSTPAVGLPAPDMSHATSLSQQVRATTVAQTPRAADSAPTSSLTMSDSSAHAALLTPQFSAAFPRFLHTHAETPTPSSRLTGKLVRN